MLQSVIIVDPKTELLGKQDINCLIVQPGQDKKSPTAIGIDQVRQLIVWAQQTSFDNKPRTIVIEQASRLTLEGQQALLKTLEEPLTDLTILVAPQQLSDLLPTIQSRCATYQIDQLTPQQWSDWPIKRQASAKSKTSSKLIDFDQFIQQPAWSQLDYLANYLKGKGDPQLLLDHWITQLTSSLQSTNAPSRQIQQLGVLHQTQQSLQRHISARLAFNALHIKLLRLAS